MKRMELMGDSVGDRCRNNSDDTMNKTFRNDPTWRSAALYSQDMQLLEEDVDFKFQYSQTYTINKDQVEYLAQFRPGYHPEKKYKWPDGKERLGFYLKFQEKNSGTEETWLIVGRNDTNSFIRYNILKCNWEFKWIVNGEVFKCLGILRDRNNYSSGVWSDGFVTSVENQILFIVPSNNYTFNIDYDQRFILSDNPIHPLVYEVSKRVDTFPLGITKITLKQDHFNPNADDADSKLCNYYEGIPEHSKSPEQMYLECTGASNVLHIGGSEREVHIMYIPNSGVKRPVFDWYLEYQGKHYTITKPPAYFHVKELPNSILISVDKNFSIIGTPITVGVVERKTHIKAELLLEVVR